jgi:Flp pilus assembly protein TadD
VQSPHAARQAFLAAAQALEGCDAIPTEPEVRGVWSAARIAATWIVEGDRSQVTAALTSATRGEARLMEAIQIARENGGAAALPALLTLVREAPHDPRGWYALSRALAQMGENEKAAAMLATALRAAPGWSVSTGARPSGLLSLWPM